MRMVRAGTARCLAVGLLAMAMVGALSDASAQAAPPGSGPTVCPGLRHR